MTTREWDASTYDALPLPHVEWGLRVVERMEPMTATTVLDAGCGTGRDAAALLARHPEVSVTCLDGSEQMLSQASERLGDAATYVHADLTQPLPIDPVDAVMSVAAFHWVTDHSLLFANLAAAMRPGARLTSDCGGQGQLRIVDDAIAAVTGAPNKGVEFAGVDETEQHLRSAGFDVELVQLRPHPIRLDDPDLLETYLATVILGGYLADLPADEHRPFVRRVREAMTEPVIDYVRLEIDAVRR